MKRSTVILGASCLSAGHLLGDRNSDLLIIDRGASVGGEFFNSYRYCQNWNIPFQWELTEKLQREMKKKGAFERPYADFFALAPMLYRELIELSGNFMLTTEITTITPENNGFKLEVYNQSGRTEIYCDNLIDTTIAGFASPEKHTENIAQKNLNAAIIIQEGTTPEFKNFKSWAGRTAKEMFISMNVDSATNWSAARRNLTTFFETETARHGARIASIAKEFDYELIKNAYQYANKIQFISPLQYDNPLQAIDAGINMAIAGRKQQ